MFFDDVVVTGVVNPKSRLESSVSVSSIDQKSLSKLAPRSREVLEIFQELEQSHQEVKEMLTLMCGVPVSAGVSIYAITRRFYLNVVWRYFFWKFDNG
jgi:hypothetical protein